MTYKIIGDSCLDLTSELKRDPHFQTQSSAASGGTDHGGGR